MARIKLTKGELKRQRDSLLQYERFLPTLQLKKQQLQLEIVHLSGIREEARKQLAHKLTAGHAWSGLLTEQPAGLRQWLTPLNVVCGSRNVAGCSIPLFERLEFSLPEYDLFLEPLWVDQAVEALREMVSLREELRVLDKGMEILRQELRVTTQRVNLFEKVKIPEAKETIRVIKIYIGDQMANAVGRSKIAKAKIEAQALQEAGV